MAFELPNFLNAPIVRGPKWTPDYSGIANFIPQALQSYQGTLKAAETPYELRHQRMMNEEKLKEQTFKNALEQEFGRKEKEADLAHKLALAQYYQQGGKGGASGITGAGGSAKERRILWNGLGPDAKAEQYRLGGIVGWSPAQTQENFINGITPESAATEKGIDLSKEEGSHILTGANRTALNNAVGVEAEIAQLTADTADDLKYFGKFGGLNETFDSIIGTNKEDRLKGLGARALQAEIAGARSRFAQSSSAQEAIHGMQKDALARVNIFEPGISGEDRAYVQRYMNEKLERAFSARKKAMTGIKKAEKSSNDDFSKGNPELLPQNISKKYSVSEDMANKMLETSLKHNMSIDEVFNTFKEKIKGKS